MKTEKCPVCGSRRVDPESVCCGVCGFALAFADRFADRKSLDDYRVRLAAAPGDISHRRRFLWQVRHIGRTPSGLSESPAGCCSGTACAASMRPTAYPG